MPGRVGPRATRVTILTPQLEEICTLPAGQVETWLSSRRLIGKQYQDWVNRIVAVPMELEQQLRRAREGAVPILVTNPLDGEDLIVQLDRRLHEHGRAVYMPAEWGGAHYHGSGGFFRHMERLVQSLPEAQVYIPAGIYGRRCVKRPRRAWPLMKAIGLCLTQPRSSDPSTWVATRAVLEARAKRERSRARVLRELRNTEERLATKVPERRDAAFSDENDHNPWVLEDRPACEEYGGILAQCEECGGLGTRGGAVRYFETDAPAEAAEVREDGWARCPACDRMFATYDPVRWTGRRHTTCGQKLHLRPRR